MKGGILMLKDISTRLTRLDKRAVITIIISFVIVYALVSLVTSLVSLVDENRLIPVSGKEIFHAIPLAVLLYALGIAVTVHFPMRQAVRWYSVLYGTRIITAIFLCLTFQYDDELGFHFAGVEQAYGSFSLWPGKGYYHLVNLLYSIFGANILLPKIVNAFVGSLLPFLASDIERWLFKNQNAAWKAFLLIGFLPPFVIFSAVNLKEIYTGFLLLLLIWILANPKSGYFRRIVSSLVCVSVLYWLRGEVWAMVGIMGMVTYYILSMKWRFSSIIKAVGVVMLSSLLIVPFSYKIQEMVWSRITQEQYFIERFAGSEATVTRFLNLENPLSARNMAVLWLRGLFSPSPLRFIMDYGIDTLLEALNILVWYTLFPVAVIALLAYREKSIVITCGVISTGILMLATLGVAMGSDPYRHRMTAMGLVALLSAAGLNKSIIGRFRWVIWIWALGAVSFTGFWFSLKLEG